MNNHTTRKRPSRKRRREQRRLLARLSFVLLIAMVAARMLLLVLDWLGIALADILGAHAFTAMYAALFMLFGWKLRGWIDTYKRKEKKRSCTPTSARSAEPPLILVRNATASEPPMMRKVQP